MIIDNCNAFAVRVTFPAGSVAKDGKPRRWAHNDTVTVVAESIDRALAMVHAEWPSATVWGANHIGSRTILMVDVPGAA